MRRTSIFLAGLALLQGCAHAVKPGACETPPPFYVTLAASERLNADARGRSLPTIVRIITLKNPHKLETADFADLWSKQEELLGEDVLSSDEVTVDPGQSSGRWYPRGPKAAYVAAVAFYRQPAGSGWRAIATLPPVPPEKCVADQKPRSGTARPGDAELRFFFEDFRVDARIN